MNCPSGNTFFMAGPDKGVHAVVVVDVEEAAGKEVVAEVFCFGIGEYDVAVAGHVYKGVVEEFGTAYFYGSEVGVEVGAEFFVAEAGEVGQGSGVGVPVAAAVVFEQGHF